MERRGGDEIVDPQFLKTIDHPTRVEIVAACALAPISQPEFRARQRGRHTRQSIAEHFEILIDCGAIEVVHSERIKGGLTHFYGASKGAFFTQEDFDRFPPALKENLSAMMIQNFLDRTIESLLAGTFDSRTERHLTWTPLNLDLAGFLELMERIDELFEWLPTLQEQARNRLDESGEKPMHTTIGLFGFESPPPEREHHVDP